MTALPAVPGTGRVGRYVLIDPLGRGSFGDVFRAYDPELECEVALEAGARIRVAMLAFVPKRSS